MGSHLLFPCIRNTVGHPFNCALSSLFVCPSNPCPFVDLWVSLVLGFARPLSIDLPALWALHALSWNFLRSALNFRCALSFTKLRALLVCSWQVPCYVLHTCICYTAFRDLFPYACFSPIHFISLLFPIWYKKLNKLPRHCI